MSKSSLKILQVEDLEQFHDSFKSVAEKNNWKIERASNYRDAKELLNKNKYDVIILDMNFPEREEFDGKIMQKYNHGAWRIKLHYLIREKDLCRNIVLYTDDEEAIAIIRDRHLDYESPWVDKIERNTGKTKDFNVLAKEVIAEIEKVKE